MLPLYAILPSSLITGPCSSIHSICLHPSTYFSCELNKFDVHKCYSVKKTYSALLAYFS
jgi:hypothetical protein